MTDERMHDRLTRAGAEWRRGQSDPVLDLPAVTDRRSHLPAYTAAAAAVLAIAGVGWAVSQLGGSPDRPAAPALPRPGPGVVPWADLAPTHPVLTSQVAALPACTASQLRVETTHRPATAGAAHIIVTLTSTGDPCRLDGEPEISFYAHSSPLHVPEARDALSHLPAPVRVTPSAEADLDIGWPVGQSCADVDNDSIRVTLADGSWFDIPGFGQTSCASGETDLQAFSVGPFRPAATGAPVGDFDSIRARPAQGKALNLEGAPGERLEFTVSVVSPRRVVLDPCPDYRIQLYYGDYGLSEEHEYALNCAAIPTRDPQGRPVLLPGRPVEFQMFVTAPKVDVPKLLWLLDGVRPRHSHAYGGITVE